MRAGNNQESYNLSGSPFTSHGSRGCTPTAGPSGPGEAAADEVGESRAASDEAARGRRRGRHARLEHRLVAGRERPVAPVRRDEQHCRESHPESYCVLIYVFGLQCYCLSREPEPCKL